jgi:uncharacterized membrane protein
MDISTFYGTLLPTVFMVLTFFVLVLIFLYITYSREKVLNTEKPKTELIPYLLT